MIYVTLFIMEITKRELENLYYNNHNKEVCRVLNITNPTLVKYLQLAKITLKGKGNKDKRTQKVTIKNE